MSFAVYKLYLNYVVKINITKTHEFYFFKAVNYMVWELYFNLAIIKKIRTLKKKVYVYFVVNPEENC